MFDDKAAQVRKEVVLALIPVASRNEMKHPEQIVAMARELCNYILEAPESPPKRETLKLKKPSPQDNLLS